ncbi:MAG: hypothetical protein ACXAB2_07720 [Candidatus Hodarchaeales archaeon]
MMKQLTYIKKHLITVIALLTLLGLTFSALIPTTGFPGVILTEHDETDELDDQNTDEIEDGDENNDDDDDGIDDDEEEVNERELQVETSAKEVQIQSKLKNGGNEDEIEIEFKTSDEPEIKVEYESEAGSLEIELSFKVRFYSLIEFNDMNSDGIYNESVDEFVQEVRLDDSHIGYLPIEHTSEAVSNTTLHIINVTSTDGVFSLKFFVVEEFTLIDGVLVTPTEMKIDIGINDFPYANDTSMLALKLRLEAETEYEHDDETEDEVDERATEEAEVDVTMNGFTGFFSWSENVLVDGVMKNVKSSPVEDDDIDINEQKIYLSYPRGTNILHDPKIGVEGILQTVDTPSGIPGFESIVTLVAIFLASIIAIYRRKR